MVPSEPSIPPATGSPGQAAGSPGQATGPRTTHWSGTDEPADPVQGAIEHVVVLALENRSFDHVLGFLDHPDPRFDGLRGSAHANAGWEGGPAVEARPTGKAVLPLDPDHSHDACVEQLGLGTDPDQEPTMAGFVSSYERKARNLAPPRWGGLLGPLIGWWLRRHQRKPVPGCGPLAMACQPEAHVPALSTLARSFAVCTRWFASVPGETWPNRGFMHAGTSDGDTDIQYRLYRNRTIFEQLEDAGCSWHLYFDDLPMACVFVELWDDARRVANWYEFDEFRRHVDEGRLPAYSFIEPNHRPPLHLVPAGARGASDSQHPGNTVVATLAEYDAWDDTASHPPTDFARADALVAHVYETLRRRPEVFERTVLLVTYDEGGGLYDHVPPPRCVAPKDSGSWPRTLQRLLLDRRSQRFDFTRLGARVPTLVISPYVAAGTITDDVRDHASIPATVRRLLAPGQPALTARDEAAAPFHTLLDLTRPPRRDDLPDLSALAAALDQPARAPTGAEQATGVPEHDEHLAVLARRVRRRLKKQGVRAAWWPPMVRPARRPTRAATALVQAAQRSRKKPSGPAAPTS
jgi:phospholipase C